MMKKERTIYAKIIDPFTTFGIFNRGIREHNRIHICRVIQEASEYIC
jgi:hypothetical protein